jgi:hypothetical protein
MVNTIITRFKVHLVQKRLPITRYDKKITSIRYNMQLCIRNSSHGTGFRHVACWRRRSQAFLSGSGLDLDGLTTFRLGWTTGLAWKPCNIGKSGPIGTFISVNRLRRPPRFGVHNAA